MNRYKLHQPKPKITLPPYIGDRVRVGNRYFSSKITLAGKIPKKDIDKIKAMRGVIVEKASKGNGWESVKVIWDNPAIFDKESKAGNYYKESNWDLMDLDYE